MRASSSVRHAYLPSSLDPCRMCSPAHTVSACVTLLPGLNTPVSILDERVLGAISLYSISLFPNRFRPRREPNFLMDHRRLLEPSNRRFHVVSIAIFRSGNSSRFVHRQVPDTRRTMQWPNHAESD